MPERPKLMHYAENISYDEFTSIYELPADTTIWRIFNTGEQTIYWSEYEKPPSKGEKSYHTLFAHSAEVPVTIPSQIYVKRSDQNSSPRVEILWTRSKEANDMARVAGGLHIGKQIVTTTSGRGIETEISGETVIAKISGEAVRISGETVIVAVSGETVIAKISGETVVAKISGEATYPQMKRSLGAPGIQPLTCMYSGVLSVELVQHEYGGAIEPIQSDGSNRLKVAMSGGTVIAKISGEVAPAQLYVFDRLSSAWEPWGQQYSGYPNIAICAYKTVAAGFDVALLDSRNYLLVAISGEAVIAKISGEATYPQMKKTLGAPGIQPLTCYYSGVLSVELIQHDDGGLVEPIESDRSNKLKVAMSGDTVRQAMQQSYVSGVLGADMTVGSGATEAVASPVVVDVEEQDVIAVECRATSVGLAGATGEVIFALQRAMISGDFESLVSGDYYPCIVHSPLNSEYTRSITRVPVEGVKCVQIGQVLNEVNANLSGVNATIGLNR
ncbi:hypothetical protein ES703_77469 [subsurface metagenome]